MATISKESIAQFWLHVFPNSIEETYVSFSDSKVVSHLLEFVSENNEEKKIFTIINNYLQQIQPIRILKTTTIKTSPKRQRSTKTTLTNIDPSRLRFTINIETLEGEEDDVPIVTTEINTEGKIE